MKAVAGTVLSSETISLRRATSIISNFASAETGAPPEVVAYSRRASKAFNELLQLHRDIKASGNNTRIAPHAIPPEEPPLAERDPGGGIPNGADERRRRKKKKMELPAELKAELDEVKAELMGAISKEGKRMKDKKRNQIPEQSRVLVKEKEPGSEERKKKKEKKRNRETELVDEESRNKYGKKRKHLDAEVEGKSLGDLSDRSEQHKKKKRRKEGQ